MNKPWVDGAIQEWLGLARVFVPGQGACYECTLTEQARRELSLRYSCPLLARENILLGKVPTTPTIASIIGAIQSQEALKLLHGMPVEAGKVLRFNGLTNEVHTSAYVPRPECESHWTYGDVTELPARAAHTSLSEMLRIVHADLGPEAVLELDQELVLSLACAACQTVEPVLKPLSKVSFEAGHCPPASVASEHDPHLTGQEPLNGSASAKFPLHILRPQRKRIPLLRADRRPGEALAGHFRTDAPCEPAVAIKLGGGRSAPAKLELRVARRADGLSRGGRVSDSARGSVSTSGASARSIAAA
jgi:hypothetical protein